MMVSCQARVVSRDNLGETGLSAQRDPYAPSESERQAQLGAKDLADPPVEPAAAPPVGERFNPFMAALVTFARVLGVAAAILYIVASSQGPYPAPDASTGFVTAANTWLEVSGAFVVAAMVVGGINWHLTKLKK